MFSLKDRTDYGEIAGGYVRRTCGGIPWRLARAVHAKRFVRIRSGCNGKIGQDIQHSGIRGHGFQGCQATCRRGDERSRSTRPMESGVLEGAKDEQLILEDGPADRATKAIVVEVRLTCD